MSVAANALATFADAKTLFGYLDDEQTKVESLINTASSSIEAYCRRALAARDYTLKLDGTGRDTLVLPEFPANSVSRLNIDADRAFSAAADIASTDYQLQAEAGILRLYAGTFGRAGAPDVVYVACNLGYALTHPSYPTLRVACLEYVDWLKSRYSGPGNIGKKGEYSADSVSISYETDIPAHIRSRLAEFTRALE